MAGIELIDIHKTYLVDNREIPVLNGINLSLPAGRITVILGQSGCGKTTLLKILAGYLSPQRGRVITPRRKVQADSLYRRKEVSYMFQGLNLLPLATVERNLQLCAEMAMLPKKQWTRRADDLIARLGLESLRHKKAGSLSG